MSMQYIATKVPSILYILRGENGVWVWEKGREREEESDGRQRGVVWEKGRERGRE